MRLSFDDIASQFDTQRGLPREAMKAWMNLVDELSDGASVQIIEPGIGTGRIALPLAAMGHIVSGTDISQPMLTACEDSARSLDVADRVTLSLSDATRLPFSDHSFDVGIVAQLLYLIPDWPSVLDELARVVQPGGHIIHLTEPTTESDALARWSATWREMIEKTGYRHTALSPADDEVHAEFLRRWPDVHIRELSSWNFGQSVADAMNGYTARIRPLYGTVPEEEFNEAVADFLAWARETFPDGDTRLDGTVTLTAMIAAT